MIDEGEPSDALLLIRWREHRDQEAFQQLVERHGSLVWRVARSHCRDPHLSEDAFQQTFLALARHADRIKPGPLAPWLHTTAWRATRDLMRQAKNQPHPSAATEHLMDEPDSQETEQADLVRAVDGALASLPEHLRALALLHGLEGLPLRQCAEQLGHPTGSIGGLWTQARQRLQRHLRRYGGLELSLVAASWQQALAASDPSRQQIARTVATAIELPRRGPPAMGLSAWATVLLAVLGVIGLAAWWWSSWPASSPPASVTELPTAHRPADSSQWRIDPPIDWSLRTGLDGQAIITLRKARAVPRQAQARWLPPDRPSSFTISYRYWSASLSAPIPPLAQWPRRQLSFAKQQGGFLVTSDDAGEARQGWISEEQFQQDDPLSWSIVGQGEIHLAELRLGPVE